MRVLSSLLACFVIAGCANDFETRRFDPATGQPVPESASDPSSKPIQNGIVYYEAKLFKVTYTFRQRLDSKGNLVGSADQKTCKPVVQKEELQQLPDYGHPRVIVNKPPLLSPGKFTVGLSNGILTSLNAESTPNVPQLIQSLFKPLDLKLDETPAPGDACNAGPTITDVVPYIFP